MTLKPESPKPVFRTVGRLTPPSPSAKPSAPLPQLVLLMDADERFWLAYPGGAKQAVDLGRLRRDGWVLRHADPQIKALWDRAWLS